MGVRVSWVLIRGWVLIKFLGFQGGSLFESGHLLSFWAFRVGAYSRVGIY